MTEERRGGGKEEKEKESKEEYSVSLPCAALLVYLGSRARILERFDPQHQLLQWHALHFGGLGGRAHVLVAMRGEQVHRDACPHPPCAPAPLPRVSASHLYAHIYVVQRCVT